MTDGHRDLREALGAYVLGALDPAERSAVEEHLRACAGCTAEVARLGALPALLGRLSEEEAASGRLVPSGELLAGVVTRLADHERVLRRRLRRWRAAAAAALVAALGAVLLLVAPWDAPPDRFLAAADPVAADAAAVSGEAAAVAWEWGTTVELRLDGLPARDRYLIWAVADDGRREPVGSWGPTASRSARVRGASSIQRDHLRRVEVTGPDGTALLAFRFAPATGRAP